jgi:hypothetical protein
MDSRLTLAQAGRDDPRGLTGMQQVGRRRLHVRAVEMSDLGVIAARCRRAPRRRPLTDLNLNLGALGRLVT